MEFVLRQHPNNIGFIAGFDKQAKLRREKGRYFLSFDPKNPTDVQQFLRLFKNSILEFDSHSAKDLSGFDCAFDQPDARQILEEIRTLKVKRTELQAAATEAAAKATIMKAAIDESTDLAGVDALISEMRKSEQAAEAAEIKSKTAERRLALLEKKLVEAVENRRKQAAAGLRKQLDAAALEFNKNIEAVYLKFWSIAQNLFPQIHNLIAFPNEVYCQSFVMNLIDAQGVKTLKAFPVMNVLPDKLEFDIKKIKA